VTTQHRRPTSATRPPLFLWRCDGLAIAANPTLTDTPPCRHEKAGGQHVTNGQDNMTAQRAVVQPKPSRSKRLRKTAVSQKETGQVSGDTNTWSDPDV
jgi:hypothetical protein